MDQALSYEWDHIKKKINSGIRINFLQQINVIEFGECSSQQRFH